MSLFLLKNSFGSKMKKGFRNFCNGDSSTSTLPQQRPNLCSFEGQKQTQPPTLEEMILQLEIEEKMSARPGFQHHRMSCVDSSDIMRSARNALNQYPRFSLDGKDAMYRSSFTNTDRRIRAEKSRRLPCVIGGESVIWCRAGVVARLMGLDAMPVPLNGGGCRRESLATVRRRQENEARKLVAGKRSEVPCSRTGYCIMKPVDLEIPDGEAGWPMRRFL